MEDRTYLPEGGHIPEVGRGKENRAPAQKEYDRVYDRLKMRKKRRKISVDERNAAVARDLLD